MKIKFLCFFLTVIFVTAAPAQDTTSLYQQELDRFLQYLDKSQIPTGVLYDRVARIAELDTLSDVINNNTNPAIKTSSLHLRLCRCSSPANMNLNETFGDEFPLQRKLDLV